MDTAGIPTMTTANTVLTISLLAFTSVAALVDVRTKKLPNRLVVPVFFAGLLFHIVFGAIDAGFLGAGRGLLYSLAGFGVGFGVLLVLWLIGGGGGGDVKYMGALGAWLGPALTAYVLMGAGLLVAMGSVLVLVTQVFRLGMTRTKQRYLAAAQSTRGGKGKRKAKRERPEERQARAVRRRLLPFAVPAALATWGVLLVTWIK